MRSRLQKIVFNISYISFLLLYCYVLPKYIIRYIIYLDNNGQGLHGIMTSIVYILVMILLFGYGVKVNSK